jgi:hypothetical protein
MLAIETHETRGRDGSNRHQLLSVLFEQADSLAAAGADRLNQPASTGKPARHWRRHAREGGGDDDRIERRLVGNAAGPVTDEQRRVLSASIVFATSEGCVVTCWWVIRSGSSR